MKKIFTLVLIAAGTIGIAAAQSKNQQAKSYNDNSAGYSHHQDVDNNKNFDYNVDRFTFREKEALIQKINREFDHKIADVKMNRYLKIKEKKKVIKALENQRKDEIAKVQNRYIRSNHRDVGFDKNDRHNKW